MRRARVTTALCLCEKLGELSGLVLTLTGLARPHKHMSQQIEPSSIRVLIRNALIIALLAAALCSHAQSDTWTKANSAGLAAIQEGDDSAAEAYFRAALAAAEADPDDGRALVQTLNNLAVLYRKAGRYAEAKALLLRAQELTATGEYPAETATTLNNLAALNRSEGRLRESEALYRQALAIRTGHFGPVHESTATSYHNLAALLHQRGQREEAETLFREALNTREAVLGVDHPEVARTLNNLAELYHDQGRYDEVEPLYLRSLSILQSRVGGSNPALAPTLNNLAVLYQSQRRFDDAERLYLRSLQIERRASGQSDSDLATTLANYAALLRELGRAEEASAMETDYRAILRQNPDRTTRDY